MQRGAVGIDTTGDGLFDTVAVRSTRQEHHRRLRRGARSTGGGAGVVVRTDV